MIGVIICVAVLCGVGFLCSLMLVFAAKFFAIPENEQVNALRACLPGANCGACGYTGCDGYAKALAEAAEEGEEIKTNLCIPGGESCSRELAEVLGVEAGSVEKKVAVVLCGGAPSHIKQRNDYAGLATCRGAKLYYAGGHGCTFACLGYGDCLSVCPAKAICLDDGVAHVDPRLCVGCSLCVSACPQGAIAVVSVSQQVAVRCRNTEKGAVSRLKCDAGCIGCKKCEKTCPSGAIRVENNIARVDGALCQDCGLCVEQCPVGCIIKLP